MVYTLNQKVKEFKLDIMFDYTLNYGKEIKEEKIVYWLNK